MISGHLRGQVRKKESFGKHFLFSIYCLSARNLGFKNEDRAKCDITHL